MVNVRRSTGLVIALTFASVVWAASASAQTSPPPDRVVSTGSLRAPDGRIRRAWGIATDGAVLDAARSPEAAARAFLAQHASRLVLGEPRRVRYVRSVVAHGTTYVRFVDTRFGGPVLGSSAVVGVRHGRVRSVSLSRMDLPDEGVWGGSEDAGRRAVEAAMPDGHAIQQRQVGGLVRFGRVVPVEWFDVRGPHRHQRTRYYVDAEAQILGSLSRFRHAQGRVFASDPVTDDNVTTDVELLHLTSRTRMTGRYFRVASCDAGERGCQHTAFANPDEAGDFLHDPDEPSFDDGFAEVNAYHHADRVAAYFRETHGFTWTCGAGELMTATVNYTEGPGIPFDNAGYAPTIGTECGSMIFGQGTVDFAYDGDVVYHEFGHAVVDQTADLMQFIVEPLGVSYAPGAINEAIADYVAATLSDDPRMAAYFESLPGAGEGALRRLDNSLTCPDAQVGEVHFDGRILAGLLWDLRGRLGVETTDALMFSWLGALDAAPTLSDAAEVLGMVLSGFEEDGRLTAAERAEANAMIEARGLLGCERIVPLDDGLPHLAYSGVSNFTGAAGARIAPVQFRVDIPPDAQSVRIQLNRVSPAGTYRLHVRSGAAPRVTGTRVIASEARELDADNAATFTRPVFSRCETFFIAVETTDLAAIGAALFEVQATVDTGGVGGCDVRDEDAGAPLDAGVPDAAGPVEWVPGGGCQCRAVPQTPAPPVWAWVGLGVAIWRSRSTFRR